MTACLMGNESERVWMIKVVDRLEVDVHFCGRTDLCASRDLKEIPPNYYSEIRSLEPPKSVNTLCNN